MKKILFLGLVSLALVSAKSNAQSLSPSAASTISSGASTYTNSNAVRKLTSSVSVYYSSDTNSGGIDNIKLYQGGVLKYTISNADLQSGTYSVLGGIYTALVTTTGGAYNPTTHTGFNSFYYQGDGNASLVCNAYSSTYSFSLDLSTSSYINFNIDYGDCN